MKDIAYYAACTAITFTDDELLGSNPHNLPLFVMGDIREPKVKQILVGGRSVVNIMHKSIMNELGITVKEISKNRMVI